MKLSYENIKIEVTEGKQSERIKHLTHTPRVEDNDKLQRIVRVTLHLKSLNPNPCNTQEENPTRRLTRCVRQQMEKG